MYGIERDLYKARFSDDILERKNAVWKVFVQHFFQKYIQHDSTVVDVACGYCEFINNIKAGKKIAIDVNPETLNFLDESVVFYNLNPPMF